ncbi:MAG: hypothetical protein KDD10_11995 [Phaeodactylibacter sp.]|nr:hypothetical protein [Phaeodactylibacter sp.]
MHTHPDDPEVWWMNPVPEHRDLLMPLFVIYGVTGTRDMAGSLEVVNDWRRRIKAGTLAGPEIIAAGPPARRSRRHVGWLGIHHQCRPGEADSGQPDRSRHRFPESMLGEVIRFGGAGKDAGRDSKYIETI